MDSEGRLNDDAKMTKGGVKGQGSRGGWQNDRRFGARIGSRETSQSVTGCGRIVCYSEQFRSLPPFSCVQK